MKEKQLSAGRKALNSGLQQQIKVMIQAEQSIRTIEKTLYLSTITMMKYKTFQNISLMISDEFVRLCESGLLGKFVSQLRDQACIPQTSLYDHPVMIEWLFVNCLRDVSCIIEHAIEQKDISTACS